MTRRLPRDDRRTQILDAALRAAERDGYMQVTREAIAEDAKCSPALVSLHLGTMPQMRRAIMGAAIARRNLRIIAQGLAHNDRRAMHAPEDIRRAAAALIAG